VRDHLHIPARKRLGAALTAVAIAILAWLVLAPSHAQAARVKCPGTFRVLHDDHIGRLALPAGSYRITILASGRPSCSQASALFTRFLEDFDGNLPKPWRINVADSTFVKSPGVGFHVARGTGGGGGGSGGGGRHPRTGRFCPGTFSVLHNDLIGKLRLPKGKYWIVLLQNKGLSCGQASALFSKFLSDPNGNLTPPWVVDPQTGKFRHGHGGFGFRVKPAGGP
jgi:hypothetical protein